MKIKINDDLTVDAVTTQTSTTPAGLAYWRIDYRIKGETLYSCSSGAIWGQPSPIEALGWEREVWDATLPGKWRQLDGTIKSGDYVKRKNRELLLDAAAQLA